MFNILGIIINKHLTNSLCKSFNNGVTLQTIARSFGVFNKADVKPAILQSTSPMVQQTCGLKIKGKPKLRCKDCYFVVRDSRLYVMCKTHGRHKQAQMQKSELNRYILTHASQTKYRPW